MSPPTRTDAFRLPPQCELSGSPGDAEVGCQKIREEPRPMSEMSPVALYLAKGLGMQVEGFWETFL